MILSLDTSGRTVGAALWQDGETLAESVIRSPRGHCKLLATAVKFLLDAAERSIRDISAVAVTNGPGFFTGLRVGISTSKAIAFALGVPLVGVSTLEALAKGVEGWAGQRAVMAVGALKKDVFCSALFLAGERGLERAWPDRALPGGAIAKEVGDAARERDLSEVVLVGESAGLLDGLMRTPGLKVTRAPSWANTVMPSVVAEIGARRLSAGAAQDAFSLEARYLRASEAEIAWTERNRGR